nr:NADH dehydrogenase subunit 4L [Photonectes albipennis]
MSPVFCTFSAAFSLGLVGLAFHRTNLLSALLCLEGMLVCLYIGLAVWCIQLEVISLSGTPILLLAFSACEASTGLAILVATFRTHGTDNLRSLSLLRC